MNPIPDVSTHLLITLLTIGGIFIAVVIYILRRGRSAVPTNHSTPEAWWLAGILTGLLLLVTLGWMDASDEQARIADLAASRVSTAACPPPGPGLTDTVVMVITSQADRQPAVTRCSRIAERPSLPRRKPTKPLTLTEAK